jgi:very-short-patch-repair endonuclease
MDQFSEKLSDDIVKSLTINGRKDCVTYFIKKNFRENIDYFINITDKIKNYGGQNEKIYMLTKDTMELVKSSYNLKHRYVKSINDTNIKNIVMTIENSTIGFICNALKFMPIKTLRQYKCGTYYIDLYIPELNLCIECDEFGHDQYCKENEKMRQDEIEEKLKCKFIRFNPNEKGFDISNVLADILKHVQVKV